MTVADADLETTGTEPDRHHAWEIALNVEGHNQPRNDGLWWFQVAVDLTTAQQKALEINRYYERYQIDDYYDPAETPPAIMLAKAGELLGHPHDLDAEQVAATVAILTAGATLYTANPVFDAPFLDAFLRRYGCAPAWSHRVRCVESLAEGHVGYNPGGARACADALGVAYKPEDLHTGLGDVQLARDIRRRVWDTERGDADAR